LSEHRVQQSRILYRDPVKDAEVGTWGSLSAGLLPLQAGEENLVGRWLASPSTEFSNPGILYTDPIKEPRSGMGGASTQVSYLCRQVRRIW
jgi:hypothetical protein